MTEFPFLPAYVVIALRIFIVIGIVGLSAIGILQLVWTRRLNRTLTAHTDAITTHSKRIAAVLALLASTEPPAPTRLSALSNRPVKTGNVIAMAARQAADELADE